MADDGRAFFATKEALVPRDTNGDHRCLRVRRRPPAADHAGSAPRLHRRLGSDLASRPMPTAVSRRSATTDRRLLLDLRNARGRDHNGEFVKFYDARTGGGFAENPELGPCAAADECHGADSSAPPPPATASGNSGPSGNVKPHQRNKKKGRSQRRNTTRSGAMDGGRSNTGDRRCEGTSSRAEAAPTALLVSPRWAWLGPAERPLEPGFELPSHPQHLSGRRPSGCHHPPRSRQARHRSPGTLRKECLAADYRYPLAVRVHRQPARRPEMHAHRIHIHCPSDSQVGVSPSGIGGAGALRSALQHGDPPTRRGCSASSPADLLPDLLRTHGPHRQRLRPRRGQLGDVRLPFIHLTALGRAGAGQDPRRFVTPLTGSGLLRRAPADGRSADPFGEQTYAKSTAPAPFLQNPTTCGVPLTSPPTSNTTAGSRARTIHGRPRRAASRRASAPSLTASRRRPRPTRPPASTRT